MHMVVRVHILAPLILLVSCELETIDASHSRISHASFIHLSWMYSGTTIISVIIGVLYAWCHACRSCGLKEMGWMSKLMAVWHYSTICRLYLCESLLFATLEWKGVYQLVIFDDSYQRHVWLQMTLWGFANSHLGRAGCNGGSRTQAIGICCNLGPFHDMRCTSCYTQWNSANLAPNQVKKLRIIYQCTLVPVPANLRSWIRPWQDGYQVGTEQDFWLGVSETKNAKWCFVFKSIAQNHEANWILWLNLKIDQMDCIAMI
jgi:hypothetical protein